MFVVSLVFHTSITSMGSEIKNTLFTMMLKILGGSVDGQWHRGWGVLAGHDLTCEEGKNITTVKEGD